MSHSIKIASAFASCIVLVIMLALVPIQIARPLSASEAALIRGTDKGGCYKAGNGVCPTPTPLCSSTACTGNPMFMTCPAFKGQTNPMTTTYAVATLTNNEGNTGDKPSGNAFNCFIQVNCNGCASLVQNGPLLCANGATDGVQSQNVIPSVPDPTTPVCNMGK